VAGALYAYRIGNVVGDDFSFALALTFVLMVVVGGLGSRLGVILGATLFATLDTYLLEQVGPLRHATEFVFRTPNLAQYDAQFLGALGLLLTIVLNPGGIAQQIRPITNWLAGKPFSLHGDDETGPASVEGSSVRA
jgi:branched-chain amino acid transport system permease protein